MNPLELIYLAATSVRAARLGVKDDPKTSAKEWIRAINVAVQGYSLVLANAPAITEALNAATGSDAESPAPSPGLIVVPNDATAVGHGVRIR